MRSLALRAAGTVRRPRLTVPRTAARVASATLAYGRNQHGHLPSERPRLLALHGRGRCPQGRLHHYFSSAHLAPLLLRKSGALRAILADDPYAHTRKPVRLGRLRPCVRGCAVDALPCAPRRGTVRRPRLTVPRTAARVASATLAYGRNQHGHLPSERPRLLALHGRGRCPQGRLHHYFSSAHLAPLLLRKSGALRAVLADGPTPTPASPFALGGSRPCVRGCAVDALPCAPRRAPFADRGSRCHAPLRRSRPRPLPMEGTNMAIYHLNARGCSPSTGAGAVRKAAYITTSVVRT